MNTAQSLEAQRVAAYHITPQEDGSFIDQSGQAFDAAAYSLVKYGETQTAWRYGIALADALVNEAPDAAFAELAVMTVPAYAYSPKPALSIARAALTNLNILRREKHVEPARLMRMHTNQMGTTAYAQASQADRQKESQALGKQHHIPTSLIRDAVVFAVDDCIITGETERRQVSRLALHGPAKIVGAYAVMVNPEKADEFPGIEHVLNVAADLDLATISGLIHEGHFALNSRVLDFILATPDMAKLQTFFEDCPDNVLQEVSEATLNSTLEFMDRHAEATAILLRILRSK